MFISSPKLKNGQTVVRLVKSYRQSGKKNATTKIIKTLGRSDNPDIIKRLKEAAQELLDKYNRGEVDFANDSQSCYIDILKYIGYRTINRGVQDIFGSCYDQLGFSKLITTGRDNTHLMICTHHTTLCC